MEHRDYFKRIFSVYHAYANGKTPENQIKNKFKHYLKWYQVQDLEQQKDYWKDYLKGFDMKTFLPFDKRKEKEIKKAEQYIYQIPQDLTTFQKGESLSSIGKGISNGSCQNFSEGSNPLLKSLNLRDNNEVITSTLSQRIHVLTQKQNITIGALFYALWGILLHKYNNYEDVLFGVTVSGRPSIIEGIEDIVGLFINTIPLRVNQSRNTTAIELIQTIQENVNKHKQFEVTPLAEIKACSEISLEESLFDSIIVLENYPLDQKINTEGDLLRINSYNTFEMTNFDLTLSISAFEQIEINFIYNVDLFNPITIERIAGHFFNILKTVVNYPDTKLADIDLLSPKEREQILFGFNNPKFEKKTMQTLHHLFEDQVKTFPEHIALVYGESQLTYQELNQRSNQIAHFLREKGIKSDQIVGIMAERSLEMIIAIFGILKAGGAYLPIATDTPKERIQYMLDDSKASLLLTQKHLVDRFEINCENFHLNSKNFSMFARTNPINTNKLTDLAYIIYTSGSTGKPKGVMVDHESVGNLLENLQSLYPLNATDAYLFKTTYAFDVSVTEIFGWFFKGGRLVIPKQGVEKDPKALVQSIKEYKITHINFVPSMLNVLFNTLNQDEFTILNQLKYLFVAGEPISRRLVQKFYQHLPNVIFENLYGPTEATIYTTRYALTELQDEQNVPIGKPLQNVNTYILNQDRQLQPIGVPGELYISGKGVARGYLNRPKLTDERFADDPFHHGKRIYQTGDLARWLPDGNIEFLGRLDHQVKIRGFRIELGEVEYHLLSHPKIKEAVVIDIPGDRGESILCGYIVTTEEMVVEKLRTYLQNRLPEYMIPSHFSQIEQIPLTSSGKVNRKALSRLTKSNISNDFLAPRNQIETKLAQIWASVLNIEQIGINQDFFALGGHSLKAMYLLNQVTKEMSVDVTLNDLFQNPTIATFANLIENGSKISYTPLVKIADEEYYPLSSAQRRIYILHQLDPDSLNYNMSQVLKIEGSFDHQRFIAAFKGVINRHDAFRTSFNLINGEPVQVIQPKVNLNITEKILLNQAELEQEIISFIKPFDLQKAPLIRAAIFKLDDEIFFISDMHHIIADGASKEIFLKEFWALYEENLLPPIELQYKDYAVWQNQWLESEKIKVQENFWLNIFANEIPILDLPTDYRRPMVIDFAGDTLHFTIDQILTRELKKLAVQHNATLYMLLLAIWNLLLAKYSTQDDIVVGLPIAGRTHPDLEKIIGMFVNTLAIRNAPTSQKTFSAYLEEVRTNALLAYKNQDYQLEVLIDQLPYAVDPGRNPLFDTIFALQNTGSTNSALPGLQITEYPYDNKTAKVDLTMSGEEHDGKIEFALNYRTSLFKHNTMIRMSEHFLQLCQAVVSTPEKKLGLLEMITTKEKEQILRDFNDTKTDYPRDKTIQSIFEEVVAKNPDHMALKFFEETLTYGELNSRANQLARSLREHSVGADVIVSLMIPRSLEMIIGILAILKAGGAYLPIDPENPESRIEYMLKDSGTKLLLIHPSCIKKITSFKKEVLEVTNPELYHQDDTNLTEINQSNNLAYIMYTSGTTGKPKGAMITHYNINRLAIKNNFIEITPKDRLLQLSNYAFDGSTFDIFGALLNGASLVLVKPEILLDVNMLKSVLIENRITLFLATTALFNTMIDLDLEINALHKVRKILFGGERLSVPHIKKAIKILEPDRLINCYGPTESTVIATTYSITSVDKRVESLPIGKPIANTQIYILDQEKQLTPIGVVGELYIAGEGLASGYLNRPELTAEKFIDNPLCPGERIYRTGDMGRWLSDGNIEFFGRIDHQVKIRGFRIECGEIETRLMDYPEIKEAVVLARADQQGNKYLAAYLVSENTLELSDITAYLAKKLPKYMIPTAFVFLNQLPLTQNGKVDRRALPEPQLQESCQQSYVAPIDNIEMELVETWSEILGVEKIGTLDNFFDLGGHSLKATRLLAKIEQKFNAKIPLKDFFVKPTVKELAELIKKTEKTDRMQIVPVEQREYYPVSSAQKQIYVLEHFGGIKTGYNIPLIFMIQGELDKTRLITAISKLQQRHESLRTSFVIIDGKPRQKINNEVLIEIEEDIVAPDELDERLHNFIRPFELSKSPLFRVGLFQSRGTHYLIFDIHHIITDGSSMSILSREFIQFYQGKELPELSIQYKDFAVWQNHFQKTDDFKVQERYWLEQFADSIPVLNLPLDYPRPAKMDFDGAEFDFVLSLELTEELKTLAKETNTTLYMILLTTYTIFLSKYTDQKDVCVGTPVAGRSNAALDPVIGMFVNTLVMRNQPTMSKHFLDFLSEVKANALLAFDNQDYPFEMLVESLKLERNPGQNPIFDTLFVLQNIDFSELVTGETRFKNYNHKTQVAKTDITLTAIEDQGEIHFTLVYRTKLFNETTIVEMANDLVELLKKIITNPNITIGEILITNPEELLTRQAIEAELNQVMDIEFDF